MEILSMFAAGVCIVGGCATLAKGIQRDSAPLFLLSSANFACLLLNLKQIF